MYTNRTHRYLFSKGKKPFFFKKLPNVTEYTPIYNINYILRLFPSVRRSKLKILDKIRWMEIREARIKAKRFTSFPLFEKLQYKIIKQIQKSKTTKNGVPGSKDPMYSARTKTKRFFKSSFKNKLYVFADHRNYLLLRGEHYRSFVRQHNQWSYDEFQNAPKRSFTKFGYKFLTDLNQLTMYSSPRLFKTLIDAQTSLELIKSRKKKLSFFVYDFFKLLNTCTKFKKFRKFTKQRTFKPNHSTFINLWSNENSRYSSIRRLPSVSYLSYQPAIYYNSYKHTLSKYKAQKIQYTSNHTIITRFLIQNFLFKSLAAAQYKLLNGLVFNTTSVQKTIFIGTATICRFYTNVYMFILLKQFFLRNVYMFNNILAGNQFDLFKTVYQNSTLQYIKLLNNYYSVYNEFFLVSKVNISFPVGQVILLFADLLLEKLKNNNNAIYTNPRYASNNKLVWGYLGQPQNKLLMYSQRKRSKIELRIINIWTKNIERFTAQKKLLRQHKYFISPALVTSLLPTKTKVSSKKNPLYKSGVKKTKRHPKQLKKNFNIFLESKNQDSLTEVSLLHTIDTNLKIDSQIMDFEDEQPTASFDFVNTDFTLKFLYKGRKYPKYKKNRAKRSTALRMQISNVLKKNKIAFYKIKLKNNKLVKSFFFIKKFYKNIKLLVYKKLKPGQDRFNWRIKPIARGFFLKTSNVSYKLSRLHIRFLFLRMCSNLRLFKSNKFLSKSIFNFFKSGVRYNFFITKILKNIPTASLFFIKNVLVKNQNLLNTNSVLPVSQIKLTKINNIEIINCVNYFNNYKTRFLQSTVFNLVFAVKIINICSSAILIRTPEQFGNFVTSIANFFMSPSYFSKPRVVQRSNRKPSGYVWARVLNNLSKKKFNKNQKKRKWQYNPAKFALLKSKVLEFRKKLTNLKTNLILLKKLRQKYEKIVQTLLNSEKLISKVLLYKKKISQIITNIVIISKSAVSLKKHTTLLVFHLSKIECVNQKHKSKWNASRFVQNSIYKKGKVLKKKQQFKNLNFYYVNKFSKKSSNVKPYLTWLRSTCFWPTRFGFLKLFLRRHKLISQPKIRKAKYIKRMAIYKNTLSAPVVFYTKKKKILEKWAKSLKTSVNGVYNSNLKKPKNITKGFIQLFWKSRNFFKSSLLRKRRWTARKFLNFYTKWWKKNGKLTYISGLSVWVVLIQNNIAKTKKECQMLVKNKLVRLNGLTPQTINTIVNKFDIITFPLGYYKLQKAKEIILKKSLKAVLRWKRIRWSNINSQWRQLKKTDPRKIVNLLYPELTSQAWCQVDKFTSSAVIIKDKTTYDTIEHLTPRHALEKLNTWRLRL